MTFSGIDRAPVIETQRLRLRAHTLEDFETTLSVWNDPIVTRHIGGRPHTHEEVWQRLLRYAGSWVLLGHGFWVIEEKATGAVIGEIGILDGKRDIEPPLEHLELGWALLPEAHGKGFASEALQAVIDWEGKVFASSRLLAIIDPDNLPSLKLAAKFGFVERARTTYKGVPIIQFELKRDAKA
jgi:RimJ/RimL family protein N-acetyltransferase